MSDEETLDQLRVERDATVSAALPTKYNQQTLVGNISGAGNRHVIEDQATPRRPINFPSQISDGSTGGITVTDGSTTVDNVTTISFDGTLFTVSDGGGGTANVTLKTTTCP